MIKAYILNLKDRKTWYIKYKKFFENGVVKERKVNTKVLKTEKSLSFMQKKFLPAWIARQGQEQKPQNSSKAFDYYAKAFLEDYEKNHDYQNMKYRIDRVLIDFKDRDISKITNLEIKRWLNGLNKSNGDDLSKNSKLKYLRVFHGVFDFALDDRVFDRNFTFDIKLTGSNRRSLDSIKPFSTQEVSMLLEKSKNELYGSYLHNYLGIAFNQGMSPAEILALQVGDIDLDNQTISITKNLTKGKIKETKTVYRDRVIPLYDSALVYFESLIKRSIDKKSLWLFSKSSGTHLEDIKDIRGNNEIVKNGKMIKPRSKWHKLLYDLQIEYRDLKNCRHTFAVSAIESKAFTLQEIASILGHGSLQMLIKHYARWIGDKSLTSNRNIDLFGSQNGSQMMLESL